MKNNILSGLLGLIAIGSVSAQGLYYAGTEATESLPLKWVVGTSFIYDDNVNPGNGFEDDSMAVNPYVGLSFVSITPQTTLDVYARLGLVYYLDAPGSMDDVNSQSRAGVNYTHRFSERLRFVSNNFISYELEPDYSYGYASSRATGAYFFWQSDNSVGFRWSERVGTYSGLRLSGTNYTDSDAPNNDRFTWELYNQFRYQLSPQTVLTTDYRYGETTGNGYTSDSTNQYLLVGAEHRFSANTIGIIRAGAQFRDVDDQNETSPYIEFALNSQLTEAFSIRSFARYGIEDYDTVQSIGGDPVEYTDRRTLRFGLNGEYVISPMLSLNGGIDYIPTDFQGGTFVDGLNEGASAPDFSEDVINAYIGLSVRFNDFLTGMVSYNYTDSSSDGDDLRDYNRNRISVGLSAEF